MHKISLTIPPLGACLNIAQLHHGCREANGQDSTTPLEHHPQPCTRLDMEEFTTCENPWIKREVKINI